MALIAGFQAAITGCTLGVGHVRSGRKDAMKPGFAASEIDTSKPHPARMYDAYLLRHEALCYRVGVRDPRRQAVAAV
jgi:hypothetical protein